MKYSNIYVCIYLNDIIIVILLLLITHTKAYKIKVVCNSTLFFLQQVQLSAVLMA